MQFAASLVKNGIPESIRPDAGVARRRRRDSRRASASCSASRPAGRACCLIAFTIVAAFIAHRFWEAPPDARMMQTAHFEKNMMIAGAFCLLYVAGGGPYSIDRWRRFR